MEQVCGTTDSTLGVSGREHGTWTGVLVVCCHVWEVSYLPLSFKHLLQVLHCKSCHIEAQVLDVGGAKRSLKPSDFCLETCARQPLLCLIRPEISA